MLRVGAGRVPVNEDADVQRVQQQQEVRPSSWAVPAISSSGRHLVRLRHGSNGGAWGVASDAVCPEKDVDRWISLLLLLLRTVIYRHRLVLRSDAGAMFTAERTNGPPPSRIVFSVCCTVVPG